MQVSDHLRHLLDRVGLLEKELNTCCGTCPANVYTELLAFERVVVRLIREAQDLEDRCRDE